MATSTIKGATLRELTKGTEYTITPRENEITLSENTKLYEIVPGKVYYLVLSGSVNSGVTIYKETTYKIANITIPGKTAITSFFPIRFGSSTPSYIATIQVMANTSIQVWGLTGDFTAGVFTGSGIVLFDDAT